MSVMDNYISKNESQILKPIPGSMGVKFSKAICNGKTKKYDIESDENGISYMEDEKSGVVLFQDFISTKRTIECIYCGMKWKHFHQCQKYREMKGFYDNDPAKNPED